MGELKPSVDIIIPAYNRFDLVAHCVDSLNGQARLNRIVVMDDCSTKEQSEYIKALETTHNNVSVYRAAGNEGFVKSCNRGSSKTTAPYMLFLNSDTEAFPHAVEYMAEALDDGFGVCGALLVFAKGSGYGSEGFTQHAGVSFNASGVPYHPFFNYHPKQPCVNTFRSVSAVTGAAMMVKRELWDKLNGFDKKFSPGCYEDVDFALRAKKVGAEIAYEPRAIFTHLQHASQSAENNFFSPTNHDKNLTLLFQKHGQPPVPDLVKEDSIYYKVNR